MSQLAHYSSASSITSDSQHEEQEHCSERIVRKSISRRAPLLADLELSCSGRDSAEETFSDFEIILDPPVIPRVSFRAIRSQPQNKDSPTMITDIFTSHAQDNRSAQSTSNSAVFNPSAACFLPIPDDFEDNLVRGHQDGGIAPVWRLQPRLSSSHQYAFLLGFSDVNSV